MTEEQWLTSADPEPLLTFVREQAEPRQLRLFACTCCHLFEAKLKDPTCRLALVVAEQYADGTTELHELQEVRAAVWKLTPHRDRRFVNAIRAATRESAWAGAIQAQRELIQYVWETRGRRAWDPYNAAKEDAYRRQADLVRDIFGNPFRPATIDPAWLEWNDGTLVKLARTIYDDRRFDLMPILGDALEDALCDNADMLDHCRGAGPHVRGCWVVDLLLDRM